MTVQPIENRRLCPVREAIEIVRALNFHIRKPAKHFLQFNIVGIPIVCWAYNQYFAVPDGLKYVVIIERKGCRIFGKKAKAGQETVQMRIGSDALHVF